MPQLFQRFPATSAASLPDDRFNYFIKEVSAESAVIYPTGRNVTFELKFCYFNDVNFMNIGLLALIIRFCNDSREFQYSVSGRYIEFSE